MYDRGDRRARTARKKKHFRTIADIGRYPWAYSGVKVCADGTKCYTSEEYTYIKRWPRGKRSKYLKRASHKMVRRSEHFATGQRSTDRKIFDFWWNYD